MGVQTALDAVTGAPAIVDAMRLADDLAFEAGRDPGVRTIRVLARALRGDDELAAIAATHALAGRCSTARQARMLVGLLSDERAFLREHAAWALGSRPPPRRRDGHAARHGRRRGVRRHARATHARAVVGCHAAEQLVVGTRGGAARRRRARGPGAGRRDARARAALHRDRAAPAARVRCAPKPRSCASPPCRRSASARRSPGWPTSSHPSPRRRRLLGDVAELALVDLRGVHPTGAPERHEGLTVAQLFLHADIDPG